MVLAKPILLFIVLASIGLFGLTSLCDYSSRPGPPGNVPAELPPIDGFTTSGDLNNNPRVLVFYHPKCPCTVSTFRCLKRLVAKLKCPPYIFGFAYQPAGESCEWIESRSTNILNGMDQTTVIPDVDGVTSRTFGVKVSGHVVIYDANNQLLFSGGLTPGRGHEGDCAAADAFIKCLNNQNVEKADGFAVQRWPVFGCLICPKVDEDQS